MNKSAKHNLLVILGFLLVVALIYTITLVVAYNTIIEDSSNPLNGTITSNSSIVFNYNISDNGEGISDIKYSADNINYSFVSGLVSDCDMKNNSLLGESSTNLVCWSPNGGFNGTISGATFNVTGGNYNNGAYMFDGVNDRINNSDFLDGENYTNGFSVSFWVYNPAQNNKIPISKGAGNCALASNNAGWLFKILSSTIIFETCRGNQYSYNLATAPISNYTWTYITGVHDTINSRILIYSNGLLIQNNSLGSASILNSTGIFYIGYDSAGVYFNGSLDDIMIFNRTLSSNEISVLYNSRQTNNGGGDYNFYTNQSLPSLSSSILNSTNPTYNHNIFLCSSNSSGSENCTSQKTITQTIPTGIIIANFSTSIGTIRSDFYGVGTYRKSFSENGMNLWNGSSYIGYSNYTWNREQFLNLGAKFMNQRAYTFSLFSNDTSAFDIKVNDTIGLKQLAEQVKFGYDNNITVMFNIVGVPEYLQNRSSPYCNSSGADSSYGVITGIAWGNCPPNNFSAWDDMIIYFLNNVTNYGKYRNFQLEVWNEPYGGYCNNLSYDSITRALEYVKLYNSTYNAIKGNSNLSWMKVVGPSGYRDAPNMTTTFISNFSYLPELDVSIHPYGWQTNTLQPYDDITDLLSECATYGANCSYVLASEYGLGTPEMKGWNRTNNFDNYTLMASIWGANYIHLLNAYPSNISSVIWMWSENHRSQYFDFVTQPELVNSNYTQFSAGYNTTRYFTNVLPAGCDMKKSLSDNPNILVGICNSTNYYGLVVINIGNLSVNQTINLTGPGITNLKNYITKENITISNNIAYLGIMDAPTSIYNQNSLLFLTEDLQSPSITIQSPISGFNYSSNTTYFNVSLNEEGSWCGYSLDGSANISMTKQGIITQFKATNSTMTDLLHNVTFTCNDTSNNYNTTEIIYFRIDTIFPLITITSPINNSNNSDNTLDVNYTFTELNPSTCWYSNDTMTTNTTLSCGTNITTITWSEGQHNVTIWINDTVNHVNSSSVTFYIDTIYPQINLTYPLNITYNINVSAINYTVSDLNLDSCWYSINNGVTNTSVACGTNLTGLISTEGSNTWLVGVNDSANNQNMSKVTFFKDTIIPLIDYGTNTAVNYANLSQTFIYVNVTWTESNFANITFTLKNDSGTVNTTIFTVATYTINWTNLPQTNYTYFVNITDTLNNKNSTDIRNIRLDWGDSFGEIYWEKDSFLVLNYSDNNYTSFNNTDTSNQVVYIYNLTNSLIYNGTNIVNSSNITANNDGNINISLKVNETAYVLNRFNLTEGVTREHSPLWVSSNVLVQGLINDVRTIHLASNLTDTINVTFIPSSTPCPNSITYTSNSGFTNSPSLSCVSGYITAINITNYEKSSSSNILVLTYNKGQGTGGNGGVTVIPEEAPNASIIFNIYINYYYKGVNVYSFPEFLRDKFDSIKIKTELKNNADFDVTSLGINEVIPIELREYFGNEVYTVYSNQTKSLWESSMIKTSDLNNSNFDLNIKLIGLGENGNTIFLNATKEIISSRYVEEDTTNASAITKGNFDIWQFVSNNFFMILIIAVVLIFVLATRWDRRR